MFGAIGFGLLGVVAVIVKKRLAKRAEHAAARVRFVTSPIANSSNALPLDEAFQLTADRCEGFDDFPEDELAQLEYLDSLEAAQR